jgi:hypothetical protein
VRQAGFHDCLDSETMFSLFFEKLRQMKLLPRDASSLLKSGADCGLGSILLLERCDGKRASKEYSFARAGTSSRHIDE